MFEALETREVPALVGSEMGVAPSVGGVGGQAPSPQLSISKTVVSVNQNQILDTCLALFRRLGPDVTSGAPRAHGQGQLKYWVCHHTGSASTPFVLINVAAPAAFGGLLRHGDMVFIRRAPGGALTTVELDGNQLIVIGPDQGPFPVRGNFQIVRQSASAGTSVGDLALQVGAVITYEIAVANTGNVPLTGLTVTDQIEADAATTPTYVSGDVNGNGNLDVGEIWTFVVSHTLTQAEIDTRGGNGFLDNVATAVTNQTSPQSAVASVPLVASLSIAKTVSAAAQAEVEANCLALFATLGADVTSGAPRAHGEGQLKYWVCHHTGSASNPFVLINVAAPAAFGGLLRHGDVVFIRRTPGGPLTTVELGANGQLIVSGPDQGPFPVRGNHTLVRRPSPTAGGATNVGGLLHAGDQINYTIVVANTGDINLTGLTVLDQVESQAATSVTLLSGDTNGNGNLDAGEIWTFTVSYTLTQADLDSRGGGNGQLDNVATATTNETPPASAAASLVLPYQASLAVTKSINSVGAHAVQDNCISLFTNLGPNVTSGAPRAHGRGQLKYWVCHHTGSASNPFVLINVAAPAAFGGLLRHGDVVFIRRTPGGPLTTVELDANGQLLVNGPDQGPFPVRAAVVRISGGIESQVSEIGATPQVGDVIQYTITVANTGNITLTGVTVTDQVENNAAIDAALVSGDTNGNGNLDVGEVWTLSASYTLTQADLSSNGGGDGLLSNTASADTNETNPLSATASLVLK
jgi:uncharacterized repeat protein (TIGR01451 family)